MKKNPIDVFVGEAEAKCKKGDHSWFDDSRLEGLAYKNESTYKPNDFGGTRAEYSTKTCIFCGYTLSGLIF